jgi:hypothetical protein
LNLLALRGKVATFQTTSLARRIGDRVWNQILDGAASMVGNSQNARHTPTVKMSINGGAEHNNSGKSVCADCYLCVSARVRFAMVGDAQYETSGEGIVVCDETGKFFDTRATSE